MGTSVGSKLHTRIEIMYNAIKEIIERNPLNIYDTRCFTEEQKRVYFLMVANVVYVDKLF